MPETLDDLYQTGSRQEGQICELRAPPHHKFVHGFISVPCTPEQLFFHQSSSGIPKRETCNIRMDTIVQFSVGKDDQGRFFAKDLFIKVRTMLPLTRIVQFMNGSICFSFAMYKF